MIDPVAVGGGGLMARGSIRARSGLGYRGTQVLAYVRSTIDTHGQAPSYRMICNHLGIATPGEVSQIVSVLERRGLLSRVGQGRVRRIRLQG